MSMKQNTSPATVPSIGHPLYVFVPGPPFAVTRTHPFTLDPFCSSPNDSSEEPIAVPPLATLAYHVPVTSTVTSVRSIQSCCAQLPNTSAVATKAHVALIGARLP